MFKDATLIKDTIRQRYYQLNFRIRNVYGSSKTIADVFKGDPIKLVDGYELAEDVSESIDKICVSDAHTHTERLVFPVFNIRNKQSGEVMPIHRCNKIDGRWTFMTHGGDSESVYPDEVYIRHLKKVNS